MDEQEIKVVEKMEEYGGSFVKALAGAFRHADSYNRGKLKMCFRTYWESYKEMCRKDEEPLHGPGSKCPIEGCPACYKEDQKGD